MSCAIFDDYLIKRDFFYIIVLSIFIMVIYVPQFYLFVVVLHSVLCVFVFFKHEIKYVMRIAPDNRPYCLIQYPVYPVSGISGIRYI